MITIYKSGLFWCGRKQASALVTMGKQWLLKHVPELAMVSLQFMYAGMSVAGKAAMEEGTSPMIFIVYRQITAALFLIPVSFISRRRRSHELVMGKKGFFLVFLSSLIGVTLNQSFYNNGIKLASATIASSVCNIIPAVTFIMAVAVGMERIQSGSIRSLAKVMGTIICVGGATFMALFKGPKLLNVDFRNLILSSFLNRIGDRWLLGCLYLMASYTCWSAWLIIQVPICRNHLDPLSLSTLTSTLAAFQAAVLSLFLEPDWKAWRIQSHVSLLFLYTGLGSAITYFVQSWCVSIRGPLFSAMFSPLSTVITVIAASLLLHEKLYIGSLVGAAVIVFGLYIVLWGKATDMHGGKEDNNGIRITIPSDIPQKILENSLEEPLISASNEECML